MHRLILLICLVCGFNSYAFTSGDYMINNNGVNIWAHVAGSGPVCIVLTPGWGASVDLYMASMQRLESRYTMVYMDDRGSGRSDKPTDLTQYAMSDFASDVEAVRKFIGADQITLVGHSMGGVIAAYYASEYAQNVAKLYLISTPPAELSDAFTQAFEKDLLLRQSEPWFQTVVTALQATPTTDAELTQQLQQTMPMYFYSDANMNASLPYFQNETFSVVANNGFYTNPASAFDITALLPKITATTYILNGVTDSWADQSQGQIIQNLVPGSTLVVFQNSGHFSFMEEPDKFFSYF